MAGHMPSSLQVAAVEFPVRCSVGTEIWTSRAWKVGQWQRTSCTALELPANLKSTLVVEGISKQVPNLRQNPRVESEHATSDAKDILLSIVNVLIEIGYECVDYAEGKLLQLIEAVEGENGRLEGSFLPFSTRVPAYAFPGELPAPRAMGKVGCVQKRGCSLSLPRQLQSSNRQRA